MLNYRNRKIITDKTKHLLVENELNKLKTLIRITLLARVTLKNMVYKII